MDSNKHELEVLTARLERWLLDTALPLWWEQGADHIHGGFHELLSLDGAPITDVPRRARVQGRQSYVYAMAGALGWTGPWRDGAVHGLNYLAARYWQPDGLYCTMVSPDGAVLDGKVMLYDQAFALLAMAWVARLCPDRTDVKTTARDLFERIAKARRHKAGGFAENSDPAFLSNPHMHTLEAALAWCETEPGTIWDTLADEIVALCLDKFIDPQGGFLREAFDEQWRPHSGPKGHIVEPGHQFEWAWLLEQWGRKRGDVRACAAARKMYEVGLLGVDRERNAAMDEMSDRLVVTRSTARLWPQTERLKAALILSETAQGETRAGYFDEALSAAHGLLAYLRTPLPGLWRDKLMPDGTFVEEPAPASSLYHIICAIASLKQALS
jgi:mannose-6-phosphate isomerase